MDWQIIPAPDFAPAGAKSGHRGSGPARFCASWRKIGRRRDPYHLFVNIMLEPTSRAYDKRRAKAKKGDGLYKKKRLCSRVLSYGSEENKRKIKLLLREASKRVLSDHFEDHLKRPGGASAPHSAKMAYPSFNVYFGRNFGEASNGVVERFAYGTGTGTQTIGLDRQTMRFNHYLEEFDKILEKIPGVQQSSFNVVSVKIYYGLRQGVKAFRTKQTARHVDVNYRRKDAPAKENSQVPGSPVLILTFGGEKLLYFSLGQSTQSIWEATEFPFLQNDSHGFYLDGADENPNNDGLRWFHRSTMHPKNRDGMVISFMFRQVCNKRRVKVEDGTLAHPGPDDQAFRDVRDKYKTELDYVKAMEEIKGKGRQLMERRIH